MYKIVLVEDNPMDSAEISSLFVANNFFIDIVTKIADLGSQISDTKVELLLLDINLPTTKSLRNLASAKKVCGDIPILVLTAFLSTETKANILASGASNVLDKANLDSVDIVELAISTILASR